MDDVYRIPESELVRATQAYARGDEEVLSSLRRPTESKADLGLVRKLMEHTIGGTWSTPPESDGWLASRLHATLRLPRRVAADRGVWFWLATGPCRTYVEWRHPRKEDGEGKAPWWRYNGDLLRNGVARLWWGAEMLRSGPDYSLVESGFRSVRTYMFVSELRYSRYREAARAFARVAAKPVQGPPLSDIEVQELSMLFNTYLRLDVLESHGEVTTTSIREWDSEWAERVPTWMELTSPDPKTLIGPDGGYSDEAREASIVEWLARLVPEARTRAVARVARKKAGGAIGSELEKGLAVAV